MLNGFWSCCRCLPHTHPRIVYSATFRVVLQNFPFPWGRALTLPLYLCAPPWWLLRWAACAVCLTTCQINAGVLWSHLKRSYSMWREGMGPSWTWQMVELFIANSYPVKLGFFLVENCLETDCGYCVCPIYSCADASMHELRDTCALCISVIG